jgi:hypothetical protein
MAIISTLVLVIIAVIVVRKVVKAFKVVKSKISTFLDSHAPRIGNYVLDRDSKFTKIVIEIHPAEDGRFTVLGSGYTMFSDTEDHHKGLIKNIKRDVTAAVFRENAHHF